MNDTAPKILMAYIDPGTGSMLFTILLGLTGVVFYGLKSFLLKIRYSFGAKHDSNKIPFVIYTDSSRYWNIFKPVVEEFEKREIEIHYLTQSEDDSVFNQDYKYVKPSFIGQGNAGFRKLNFLNADVLLSTTPSLDVYQWKRSKDTSYYIHMPHACSDVTLYKVYGIDYYDALLSSGQFQIDQVRELERIRNLPEKDCRIVGLTYFDELKKRLDNSKKIKNDIPVILVAPTWGVNSILNRYKEKIIDALIRTGFKVIIRPHPQSWVSELDILNDIMNKCPDIEFNRDADNFDVLNKSDILISDYSGVIFDFALVFDKPIIYSNVDFDDSPYDAHWLSEEPWTFRILPKIGKQISESDFDNFKEFIDDSLNNPEYKKMRKEVINEAWNNIGRSASAVCDYMIEKQKELNKE